VILRKQAAQRQADQVLNAVLLVYLLEPLPDLLYATPLGRPSWRRYRVNVIRQAATDVADPHSDTTAGSAAVGNSYQHVTGALKIVA